MNKYSIFLCLSLLTLSTSLLKGPGDVIKAFHIDCGRKYFIKYALQDMIDTLTENDYNTLELAIGNDGFRFLLDDMSLTVGDKFYSSDSVKAAINEGNKKYADFGEKNELTQSEMEEVIAYADKRGISILPLVNTPGHMDAILYACTSLTGIDCSYDHSRRTIDVTNEVAINFTLAFVKKFIDYFKDKVQMFNMGGDEYANDIYTSGSMGFGHLIATGKYGSFITYINQMAKQVKEAGLKPVAFNDGFYFNGNVTSGTVDKDIMVSYWSQGWSEYKLYPAKELAKMGYKFLNTNGNWYYVLNWEEITEGRNTFEKNTIPGIHNNPYNHVIGSGEMQVEGCMICFWCDQPLYDYTIKEKGYLDKMIAELAEYNPGIFNPKK